jgi:NADPH2:quinone reductase
VRALRASASAPYLAAADVAAPEPEPDEALVRVHAFSLNRGELLDLRDAVPGTAIGWDFAGVVQQAPEHGRPAGTRVAGLVRQGAWAEYVAVPVRDVAAIPDGVGLAAAAAVPTAGLTALLAHEVAGTTAGTRVLVTGATGGVGRFAVQLARELGADVDELARGDEIDGDYDVIVDMVGGATFGSAIEHLRPRGIVVSIGTDETEETVSFRAKRFDRSPGARVYTLDLRDELAHRGGAAPDLGRLLALVASGSLDPSIGLELPWQETEQAVDALLARRVRGKAVLHLA